MKLVIRSLQDQDILQVANIHKQVFLRQKMSREWIISNFNAYPKTRCFVAEGKEILGYVLWTEKSGFRQEVVLELEQIAILPVKQGQGIGTSLILQSIKMIDIELKTREAFIKHILVYTRTDNEAQNLYAKILNAKPAAIISNLFSADEVIMLARNLKVEALC